MNLKEEIIQKSLNEMPRNYSYHPDATADDKKETKRKVGENISDTLKRLSAFDTKVRNLIGEFDKEMEAEVKKVRDEKSTRFGPFHSMGRIKSNLNNILVDIAKAKTKVINSGK